MRITDAAVEGKYLLGWISNQLLDAEKGGLGDFASPPFGLIADGIFLNGLINIEFTIIILGD